MAGTTNELEALKAGRTADKMRVDCAQDQQKTNALAVYRKSVEALMITVKKQGDLDSYLVLEAEKKRLAVESTINTNDVPALESLVAQYQKNLQEAASVHSKAMTALLRQYVERLTTLMQNYTRTDRLDDAKIVRDELQVAKTELAFLEADAPAESTKSPPAGPSATTPARPTDELARNIPGTWTFTWRNAGRSGTDTVILSPDGAASCPKDKVTGTWELKDRQCTIHWPDNANVLTVAEDGKRMMGHTQKGSLLSVVKVGQ